MPHHAPNPLPPPAPPSPSCRYLASEEDRNWRGLCTGNQDAKFGQTENSAFRSKIMFDLRCRDLGQARPVTNSMIQGGGGIIYFMIVAHNNAIPTLVMIANNTQRDKDKNM